MTLIPLKRSRYEAVDPLDPESLESAEIRCSSPKDHHADEGINFRHVAAFRRPTLVAILAGIGIFMCMLFFPLQLVLLNDVPRSNVAELQKRLERMEERETTMLSLLTGLQQEIGRAQGLRGIQAPSSAYLAQPGSNITSAAGRAVGLGDKRNVQSLALLQPTVPPPEGNAGNSVNKATLVSAPEVAQPPSIAQPSVAQQPSGVQPLSGDPPSSVARPPSGVQPPSNYEAIRAAAEESLEDLTNFDWPKDWLKTYSADTLAASAKEALPWKTKTLNAMKHAWRGYSRPHVYGADTLRPISGLAGHGWAKAAFTMVDALSTLWLMGMHEEFTQAAMWIEKNLRFDHTGYVSVFEIVIRELGGLLGAYALSHNAIFKKKAHELGEKLMPAFEHTIPSAQISLGRGLARSGWSSGVLLAEVGTLQLEFRYLSEITGDPKFKAKGDAAMDVLLKYGGSKGLIPAGWAGPFAVRPGPTDRHITLGATGDSYYEYLLKLWVQGGKKEPKFLDAWTLSMRQMKERLVRNTPEYSVVLEEASPGRIRPKMDHLVCFVGGMLALGDHEIGDSDDQGYFKLAEKITAGCFEMYTSTKTGLAPEIFGFRSRPPEPAKLFVKQDAKHYLLRPETAESIFYLFYYTGNPKYRRWAGHIIDALEKETKGPYGYCSIRDVTVSPASKNDEMESFFLAETLKYLYLTLVTSPKEVLDLDHFVFNTEAHPLPRD
eukprot:GEMP01024026.1.p1 GENE.GEMP01024026.1~~GEMP01024026.1.p1  ORF type:complete len:717 (+),score=133.02 GEMP01024026.1:179-2329(+)